MRVGIAAKVTQHALSRRPLTHIGDVRLDGLCRPLQKGFGQIVRLLVQVLQSNREIHSMFYKKGEHKQLSIALLMTHKHGKVSRHTERIDLI